MSYLKYDILPETRRTH